MEIILDLFVTLFLYMILPVLAYFNEKKGFTKKQLIQFVSFNSIVIYIIIFILYIITSQDKIPNILPSIIYAGINYLLLKKHLILNESSEKDKDKEENENLERFIELLEKQETKEK